MLIRTDFMDDQGIWRRYRLNNSKNSIKCEVKYVTQKSTVGHVAECSDKTKYIDIYTKTKVKNSSEIFFASSLVKILYFKNNQFEKKIEIEYGKCREYNNKNELVKQYECYPYEETRPVTLRE